MLTINANNKMQWLALVFSILFSGGLLAQDLPGGTRSFSIASPGFGTERSDSVGKRNWLLSGQVRSGYQGGMYHLQYNDFGIGYKGRRLVGGLRVVLSVGTYDDATAPSREYNPGPAAMRFDRDFRWNDTTFMMSFGKRW